MNLKLSSSSSSSSSGQESNSSQISRRMDRTQVSVLFILLQLLALCPLPQPCQSLDTSSTSSAPGTTERPLDLRLRDALLARDGHPGRSADLQVVYEAWQQLMSKGKHWSHQKVYDNWLPYIEQKMIAAGENISQPCQRDVRRTLVSFARLDTWAVQCKSRPCRLFSKPPSNPKL